MLIFIVSGNLTLLHTTRDYVLKSFPQFLEDVHERGWKTDVCLLGADEWRFECQSSIQTIKTM